MKYEVNTVEQYVQALPEDRRLAIEQLRHKIKKNLPQGFEETYMYDMITYVIPLSLYPKGYHVKKGTPLPFLSIASQKHTINVYHLGMYADPSLHAWYVHTYQTLFSKKPDMGKSCLRFKKIDNHVISLISQLVEKMTPHEYIALVEHTLNVHKKQS